MQPFPRTFERSSGTIKYPFSLYPATNHHPWPPLSRWWRVGRFPTDKHVSRLLPCIFSDPHTPQHHPHALYSNTSKYWQNRLFTPDRLLPKSRLYLRTNDLMIRALNVAPYYWSIIFSAKIDFTCSYPNNFRITTSKIYYWRKRTVFLNKLIEIY